MNELDFLNHVRDAKSSYIAKYFLIIKNMEDRTEKDFIYDMGDTQEDATSGLVSTSKLPYKKCRSLDWNLTSRP